MLLWKRDLSAVFMLLYIIDVEGKTQFSLCMDIFFPSATRLKKKAIFSSEVLEVRYFTTLEFGDKKDEKCPQN